MTFSQRASLPMISYSWSRPCKYSRPSRDAMYRIGQGRAVSVSYSWTWNSCASKMEDQIRSFAPLSVPTWR